MNLFNVSPELSLETVKRMRKAGIVGKMYHNHETRRKMKRIAAAVLKGSNAPSPRKKKRKRH